MGSYTKGRRVEHRAGLGRGKGARVNRVVFALVAWVFVGLEWGLRDSLQIGTLNIAPSFVLILATMVALWATPSAAIGSAVVLGLALDDKFL